MNSQEIKKQQNIYWLDYMYWIIALLLLSCPAIFVKISLSELSAVSVTFNRFWMGGLIFLIWETYQQNKLKNTSLLYHNFRNLLSNFDSFIVIVLSSLFFPFSMLLWNWSMSKTTVANATVLHNMVPLFTCILGWLLFRKHLEKKFVIGMVAAVVGSMILGIKDITISLNSLQGDLIAMISAIFYAVYILSVEKLLKHKITTTQILLLICFVGTLLSLIVSLKNHEPLFPTSWEVWVSLIILGVFIQGLAHGLLAYSLKKIPSELVSIGVLAESIITMIGGWLIFSQILTLLDIISLGMILSGVYIITIGVVQKTEEKNNIMSA